SLRPAGPRMDVNLHEAIGRVMAERIAKALGDDDTVVLVVPVCNRTRLRAVETQVASFEETLKRISKLRIAAKEIVQASTPRVDELLSADCYFRLTDRYPNAKAIVSFAGVGNFREEDLQRAATRKLPIYAISMSTL